MKKIILITPLLFLTLTCIYAQSYDAVIKSDGTTIQGKVLKVSDNTVEIDPKGDIPFIIINRDEIESILYSNGTFVKLNPQPNELEESKSNSTIIKLMDKDGFEKRELAFLDDIKGKCYLSPAYYPIEINGSYKDTPLLYSSNPGSSAYRLELTKIAYKVTGQNEGMFSKNGPHLIFQSMSYTISLLKDEEVLITKNFTEPNFIVELSRSFIQGSEKYVTSSRNFPDFVSDQNTFSYGGITFRVFLKFWDATWIWEPNTRIGDAYFTYIATMKVYLDKTN